MGKALVLDHSNAAAFATDQDIRGIQAQIEEARETLLGREGAGNDFLGWIDLPVDYDKDEYARIKAAAERIRSDSDVLLVIGIGGSYLGARAAIEYLGHSFRNELAADKRRGPEIYFVGNNVSGTYLKDLMDVLEGKTFSINMISKSGTTTEPGVSFRFFKELLEQRCGKDGAAKRIYATTDKARGALKDLADSQGYETFVVPDDVGGRFSVLTAVGLLPIAVSGADIDALMAGAAAQREELLAAGFDDNIAMQYAAYRHVFYGQGKGVELLASFEPGLHTLAEWWKQLYGESEGKDHKGLFPASVDFTTDLHSMGQYIQDGERLLFETVLCVEEPRHQAVIPASEDNQDGLAYLAGKDMDFVNKSAQEGTIRAHVTGGVPVLAVRVPDLTEESLGRLFYFFEFACGISGYALGVNPFNQPGMEEYKKNMFELLGKPGFTK